jgi:hypothetical protein
MSRIRPQNCLLKKGVVIPFEKTVSIGADKVRPVAFQALRVRDVSGQSMNFRMTLFRSINGRVLAVIASVRCSDHMAGSATLGSVRRILSRTGSADMAAQTFPAKEIIHQVCRPGRPGRGLRERRQRAVCPVDRRKSPDLGSEKKPGLIDHSRQGEVQPCLKGLHLFLVAGSANLFCIDQP